MMNINYNESYGEYYITRRRFEPDETIVLKDDRILYMNSDYILTKWDTLTPRKDFAGGISAYYPDENWKVSLVYRSDGSIYHWYCDILETILHEDDKHIETNDMLLDVIIRDGQVFVVDADELAQVLEANKVSPAFVAKALRSMDRLLKAIYSGEFKKIKAPVEEAYRLMKKH